MPIREANNDDIDPIMVIFKETFDRSIFKNCKYDEGEVYRNISVSIIFDNLYAKIYESGDKIVGVLCGGVSLNNWGVKCGQDTFMFGEGGTQFLIKDFLAWSNSQGAEFTQISDFAGSDRYHKMIEKLGLKKVGTEFIGGLS